MQVIQPSHYTTKETNSYQRNLWLGLSLSGLSLVIFILPLTGLLPAETMRSNVGFGGLVIVGLSLLGGGVWFGRLAWLYHDERLIQTRVIKMLSKILNDDYKYLRNLNSLANRAVVATKNSWLTGNTGETSGVLLGPHGAWVLQICRYRGVYACEGDTWYKYSRPQSSKAQVESDALLDKRRLDDSPNWQVIRAAREVKAWLSVRDLPQVSVQPVVILARGKLRFSKRPSCPIVELWYLETYIKKTLMPTAGLEAEVGTVNETVVTQIVERLKS